MNVYFATVTKFDSYPLSCMWLLAIFNNNNNNNNNNIDDDSNNNNNNNNNTGTCTFNFTFVKSLVAESKS